MQMYSNWVWVNEKDKTSFQTAAHCLPPRIIYSKPGNWVAFKAKETPHIETLSVVGNNAIINNKKYPIEVRIVV